MKHNLSDLFNMTELKRFIFKRDNLKGDYCRNILQGNYKESSKLALKLYDASPFYLIFSYFLQLEEDKNIYKLLEILIGKIPITPDLALFLAQKNLFVDLVKGYLQSVTIKDYIYYLTMKELIVNEHLPFEESILDGLDEWGVYEIALKRRIELKKRETLNYKYFVLHLDPLNKEAREYLFNRIRIYKDLEYLISLTKIESHKDYTTNSLIDFIKNGFNLEKAKEIYCILKSHCKNESFNLFKLLLAHLIASKNVNLLLFALYLAHSHRKLFVNNYEISLIYLFLCRFFCLGEPVKNLFTEFDIKNNQFYNLYFVWNDLALATNRKDSFMANKYISLLKDNLKTVEETLKHFIEKGKILHSLSLIKTYNKLKEEVVAQEISLNTFIGTSSTTLFSDLLGTHCSYLFRKLTVDDKIINEKSQTLFGEAFSFEDALFVNPIESVKDEDFINWLKINLDTNKA